MTYTLKPPGSFPTIVQPNTRVSNRSDIYDRQEENDTSDADTQRMDALMQHLMGNSIEMEEDEDEDEAEDKEDVEESEKVEEPMSETEAAEAAKPEEEENELEAFSFKLFSSKQVTKISLQGVDRGDEMAAEVARQQVVDHDEDDPEFAALIAASAVSYDQIMEQSKQSYGLAQSTHVVNVPLVGEPKQKHKKRKSKECRAFNRAVKAGTIKPEPRMRNPQIPNGWPGWPGIRTCFAIITKINKDLKRNQRVVKPYVPRGGAARGRGSTRGSTRGSGRGRGGVTAQGIGRVSSSTSDAAVATATATAAATTTATTSNPTPSAALSTSTT
ncbi:hypothetical protein J3Q64DRAFT_1734645 [Phycomyces blakesleeanus]|uniref:Uncharacterized protein n=1 Tax=Phycomyces blakesleeanus TaxID=4837 RepID=A0ABR3B3K9_PHYBL